MHPLENKSFSLMVDEQVINLLFISLTGFTHKTGEAPMKGYKSQ